jgi:membrane protein implicated in regulation of membrane protease activity
MSAHIVWWILAAVLVGAELLSGTFFLLAIGVAFAVGGMSAWMGASPAWQFAIAAVVAVAGTLAARRWRLGRATAPALPHPDVGQEVRVEAWQDGGKARVAYRGSQWDAELESPATPQTSRMFIAAVRGSQLILTDRRPPP